MTDRQLTELLSNPQLNPMEMKAVEDLLALHRRMEINPQTSQIMGQDEGIGSIPTGDMVPVQAAGGGIIAFADGNQVKSNAIGDKERMRQLEDSIAKHSTELWGAQPFSKSDAMQAQYAKQAQADKDAEVWNFLKDVGIGTAKGTSTSGLTNLTGGADFANTEAGKRGAQADANSKLAMQQQVEIEKAENARKAGMLNTEQTSLTQLQAKELGLAGIAAQKEASAASAASAREAALLPKYYQIYSNQLAKNKTSIVNTLKNNFKFDTTPEEIDAMAIAQTNKQFDPKMLSLIGVINEAPAPAPKTGAPVTNAPKRTKADILSQYGVK
jgi:hypothetical protein